MCNNSPDSGLIKALSDFLASRLDRLKTLAQQLSASHLTETETQQALFDFTRNAWAVLDSIARIANASLWNQGIKVFEDPATLTRQCSFYTVRRSILQVTPEHPLSGFFSEVSSTAQYAVLSFLYNVSLFVPFKLDRDPAGEPSVILSLPDGAPETLLKGPPNIALEKLSLRKLGETADWLASIAERFYKLIDYPGSVPRT